MSAEPDALRPADASAVLEAGVSAPALREAVEVAYLFNVYNRLADAMGWRLLRERQYDAAARGLLKRGYRIP